MSYDPPHPQEIPPALQDRAEAAVDVVREALLRELEKLEAEFDTAWVLEVGLYVAAKLLVEAGRSAGMSEEQVVATLKSALETIQGEPAAPEVPH